MGIEPTNSRLSTYSLCLFAYPDLLLTFQMAPSGVEPLPSVLQTDEQPLFDRASFTMIFLLVSTLIHLRTQLSLTPYFLPVATYPCSATSATRVSKSGLSTLFVLMKKLQHLLHHLDLDVTFMLQFSHFFPFP